MCTYVYIYIYIYIYILHIEGVYTYVYTCIYNIYIYIYTGRRRHTPGAAGRGERGLQGLHLRGEGLHMC